MSTFPVRTLRFLFLILLAGATCASQNPPTRQRKPHRAMAVSTSKPSVAVSPGSWSQLAKLVVKGFNDGLGQSVAVSGETVVAAPYPDRSKLAYVFLGSADGWSNLLPVAGLGAPNSVEALLANVAIDGDTIVIGTPSFEGSGPGYAYVYFIYGNHYCLNVSCERDGKAGGVLFRAVEPLRGIEEMARARKIEVRGPRDLIRLTSGPGRMAEAFGITRTRDNGCDLTSRHSGLWIGDDGFRARNIKITPRIGISKAADKRLRYIVAGNAFVSGRKTWPHNQRTSRI